jgi:hypothetical protein
MRNGLEPSISRTQGQKPKRRSVCCKVSRVFGDRLYKWVARCGGHGYIEVTNLWNNMRVKKCEMQVCKCGTSKQARALCYIMMSLLVLFIQYYK